MKAGQLASRESGATNGRAREKVPLGLAEELG